MKFGKLFFASLLLCKDEKKDIPEPPSDIPVLKVPNHREAV